MDLVFHYYSMIFLAERAGFNRLDAQTLAYSCQYTDNALIPYKIQTEKSIYEAIATHHFGFWDKGQENSVWKPFHFVPSLMSHRELSQDDLARIDKKEHPFSVRPNADPAKDLLIDALKTRNLYRMGIAFHTFADTWAHQNFTGEKELYNRFDSLNPIPPIGHAHAGRRPDQFNTVWIDPRLQADHALVFNRDRFLAAAGKIYKYLATFKRRSFEDHELVIMELDQLLGPRIVDQDVIEMEMAKNLGLDNMIGKSIQKLIQKLSSGSISERLNERHAWALAGWDNKTIADNFQIEFGIKPYDRNAWKNQAILLNEVEQETNSLGDKILWLKHEILHRSNLLKQEPVKAKGKLENTPYFQWMEAAKAHKTAALQILKQ